MNDPNTPAGPPSSTPPPPPGGAPPGGDAPGAPPPPPPGGSGTTPPPPPSGGGTESPNRGLMIVLSYLWILALVPLLTEKDDKEVQWHAKHGLVLMVAEIIAFIILFFVGMATAWIDMGCGGCVLNSILWVVIIVIHVLCIMKGVKGERFTVPGITPFVDRF